MPRSRYNGYFFNQHFHRDLGSAQDLAKIQRKLPISEAIRKNPTLIPKRKDLSFSKRARKSQKSKRVAAASKVRPRSTIRDKARPNCSQKRKSTPSITTKSNSEKNKHDRVVSVQKPLNEDNGATGSIVGFQVCEERESKRSGNQLHSSTVNEFPRNMDSNEPAMGRAVPTVSTSIAKGALTADEVSKRRWGKKSVLALKEPAKTRSRCTWRSNVSIKTPKRRPGSARVVHFADESEHFVSEETPTASGPIPLFHPGADIQHFDESMSPVSLLLTQPLLGSSPHCKLWDIDNFFVPVAPQGSSHPIKDQHSWIPNFGQSFGVDNPCFRPKYPPSNGFIPIHEGKEWKPSSDRRTTQYAEPFPLRVTLASGHAAQISPIRPCPDLPMHDSPINKKHSKMFSSPPTQLQTEMRVRGCLDFSESHPENSESSTPDSPSTFLSAKAREHSKQSPSSSQFSSLIGWSGELSYAMDLNDCLEGCKHSDPRIL